MAGRKLTRRQELLRICDGLDDAGKTSTTRIIDEMLFLEKQLTDLKKKPFMIVHPKNPEFMKQTAAAKLYKELLQQYTNCVKILLKVTGGAEIEEESPLRSFMRQMMDGENNGKNQGN